jgi:hypothetical protein
VISAKWLKRAEVALAVVLSATVIFLLAVRVTHAGALWRDECAVANLAQMPSVSDVAQNFQHEAFPLPFPLLLRGYMSIFGNSDVALRAFGFAAGLLVICALWLSSFFLQREAPLVSLAVLGFNITYLVWGTTLRGYGLGSAFIILAFASFGRVLLKITPASIAACAIFSLAAVQCLVHNLALVSALSASASLVVLFQHDLRRVIVFLSVLALCLASFLPYVNAYSSSWSLVVEFPVTFHLIWQEFNFALGNAHPLFASFWYAAFIACVVGATWRLYRHRSDKPESERVLLASFLSVALLAPLFYYEFLSLLSYLTRAWYFLALLSLLAVTLDSLAATLSSSVRLRVARLIFAAIALFVLPLNAWPKLVERQTNIDLVARKITASARSSDLIVLMPWQYGISFERYYHGPTRCITLPVIADLAVHRYDLFLEKMSANHPIDDVLEDVRKTLTSGNRVWLVGGIRILRQGETPLALPPLSSGGFWADNVAYTESWRAELSVFVRKHAHYGQRVPVPSARTINEFEDVPLVMAEGWQ